MSISGANGANGASAANGVESTSQASSTTKVKKTKDVPVGGTPKTEAEVKQDKAKKVLTNKIKSGNAVYNESNIIGDALAAVFDKKTGNNIIISGLPKGTTLGDIRKEYNLPAGSLRHLVPSGGGDFDSYPAPEDKDGAYFYVYDDNLAEGVGVSTRELKGMFPEKQFSPWYKLGTNK